MPKNKKSMQTTASRNKLLAELIDNIPDVIYIKDRAGRLILVNKAHARGLGLKPQQIIGKTDFDIFPKERAAQMAKDDAYVMKTKKPIVDKIERATRPDGLDNYVSTTKIPRLNKNGKVIGLMGITRDITQRIRLERLRGQKGNQEKILRQLEKGKADAEVASVVSHELKSPLAVLKQTLLVMLDGITGPLTSKQRELLNKSRDTLERLGRLVEEMLELSRIEKGKIKLHFSLINLNNLLRDAAEMYKKLAEAKGIELSCALPRQEANIFIDLDRVIEVISNLLDNAIKYTEENGQIKIELQVLEEKVRVEVSDTGIGIPQEDLPKIFKKFTQVGQENKPENKGLGLGLCIARELTEAHAGEIWAESKLGVGSKFYFTLPRLYTTSALPSALIKKINKFIKKNINIYFITLSFINFKEFKKRIKIRPERFFRDLNRIINRLLAKESQVCLFDYGNARYNIIFPQATEKEAGELCESLKIKIGEYFNKHKIENAFINIRAMLWSEEGQPVASKQLLFNLYLKKLYAGAELRRFMRANFNAPVTMFLAGSKKESCRTLDISRAGACLICSCLLKTDAQVDLRLELFPKKNSIRAKARVAWIKYIEDVKTGANHYKVGVEFLGLRPDDKRRISRLVQSLS